MLVLVLSIIILIIRNEMKDIPMYPEEIEQQFVKLDTLLNRIIKETQQKQKSALQNKENINNKKRIYINSANNMIFPQSNVKATNVMIKMLKLLVKEANILIRTLDNIKISKQSKNKINNDDGDNNEISFEIINNNIHTLCQQLIIDCNYIKTL